jgi:hypothetical protein
MKNTILFWQKTTAVSLLAVLFFCAISVISCDEPTPRIPSIADEIIRYSGNYEILNDSIAVLKDGKGKVDFIYKKNILNNRWKKVM